MQDSDTPSRNIYAAAYMRPVYDNGGNTSNPRDNVRFVLNMPTDPNLINPQFELGRDSLGNETDDFWVVYVQLAYQGDVGRDTDPTGSTGTVGGVSSGGTYEATGNVVPFGGNGSICYIETAVDYDLGSVARDFRIRVVPHEVGHQFGLQGDSGRDANGNYITQDGIMNDSGTLIFVPRHLNTLRWRVKSPGQF